MKHRKTLLILISIALIVFISGCAVKLNRVVPKSAVPGSVINLRGYWFGDEPGQADVYFGETKAVVTLWGKREITVKVPEGTGTVEIFVEKDGKKSKGSEFTFLEEEYEVLGSIETTQSGALLKVDGVSVKVPPGVVNSGLELKISEVTNSPSIDEEIYLKSRVYGVTLGDYSNFDDFLMLEFDIEKGMDDSAYITAAYWDENSKEWIQSPSLYNEDKGTVSVYTDHLTNWRLLALKKIYSVYEADHFLVAYNKRDKTDIPDQAKSGTIAEMAKRVGTALDDSYLKYSSAIGTNNSPVYSLYEIEYVAATLNPLSWLRGNKEIVDSRPIVRMSSSYNKFGAEYSWTTGRLIIPTKYAGEKDLKTTAAHELFHAFQNYRLSVLQMGEARWLMEATAEYASYYVGNSYSIEELHKYTMMKNNLEFFENREEGHEYGMSAYIKYLMEKGADFGELWNTIVEGRSDPGEAFDSYVLSSTGESNHTNYRVFWQKVLTDSEMPEFNITNIGVKAKSIRIGKTLSTNLEIKYNWAMAAVLTQPKKYNSDGSRTMIVEADGILPSDARIDVFQVSGFDKKTFTHDRVPGGLTSLGSISGNSTFVAVDFNESMEQVIYATAFSGEKGNIGIKISDIPLKLSPDKLEDVQPLKEYKFQATADNIPTSISNVTVSWYLNDGTFLAKQDYPNKRGKISDKIAYEFAEGEPQDVVVTFEDSLSGKKITSGRIKVSDTRILAISYQPSDPKVKEGIEFSTKGDSGWYYKWDTGVTGQVSGKDLKETTDSYGQPGKYQIQVTAYSDAAMTKSVGFGTVVITIEALEEVVKEPDPTVQPTVTPTAKTRWLAFDKDDYLPGEQMNVEINTNSTSLTTYESMDYYEWSAKPADEETLAAYRAVNGSDFIYENKPKRPGSLAPVVPGTYEITGTFVQDTSVKISGQFVVKDGTDGYWQRILYEDKDPRTFDTITTDSDDSRIKTHTVINSTAFTFNSTRTTSYPDGTTQTEVFEMIWSDLPEILSPGEIITLTYSSYYEGEQSNNLNKTGLAVFYNGIGSEIGIISPTSYAVANVDDGNSTVQFEVPAYGYIGNATKSIELGSGMGLYTQTGNSFRYDNYLYLVRAVYQYTEDGETY